MPNVLIRDVPTDDLEQIRAAATERGTSLQSYLRDALLAQASYLRRQAALTRTGERLRHQRSVPADDRAAVLQAITAAHEDRSGQLSDQHVS